MTRKKVAAVKKQQAKKAAAAEAATENEAVENETAEGAENLEGDGGEDDAEVGIDEDALLEGTEGEDDEAVEGEGEEKEEQPMEDESQEQGEGEGEGEEAKEGEEEEEEDSAENKTEQDGEKPAEETTTEGEKEKKDEAPKDPGMVSVFLSALNGMKCRLRVIASPLTLEDLRLPEFEEILKATPSGFRYSSYWTSEEMVEKTGYLEMHADDAESAEEIRQKLRTIRVGVNQDVELDLPQTFKTQSELLTGLTRNRGSREARQKQISNYNEYTKKLTRERIIVAKNLPSGVTEEKLRELFPKMKKMLRPIEESGEPCSHVYLEFSTFPDKSEVFKQHQATKIKIDENVLELTSLKEDRRNLNNRRNNNPNQSQRQQQPMKRPASTTPSGPGPKRQYPNDQRGSQGNRNNQSRNMQSPRGNTGQRVNQSPRGGQQGRNQQQQQRNQQSDSRYRGQRGQQSQQNRNQRRSDDRWGGGYQQQGRQQQFDQRQQGMMGDRQQGMRGNLNMPATIELLASLNQLVNNNRGGYGGQQQQQQAASLMGYDNVGGRDQRPTRDEWGQPFSSSGSSSFQGSSSGYADSYNRNSGYGNRGYNNY